MPTPPRRAPALLLAAGLALPAAAAEPDPPHRLMLANYLKVMGAVNAAMEAESEFAVARAAADERGMHDAASAGMASLLAAAYWSAVLDEQVTPENTSQEIDDDVTELRVTIVGVYQRLLPLVIENDLEEIGRRLDGSQDTLNDIFAITHRIWDRIGPQR